ncbi:hypothetical protein Zmor_015266 [Zophobas morio]|uniref:Uncharacterized protein n=1 Tax=Zophobas morio TaxID=2755281 RepID=A0AA38MHM5_9CUCU|nr:hypothetical protein Zmor_015266 [Zophobas morio]
MCLSDSLSIVPIFIRQIISETIGLVKLIVTRSMGFPVCATMMDDSSLVTAFAKEKPTQKRKLRKGAPNKSRNGDGGVSRRTAYCLNGNHRREQAV